MWGSARGRYRIVREELLKAVPFKNQGVVPFYVPRGELDRTRHVRGRGRDSRQSG